MAKTRSMPFSKLNDPNFEIIGGIEEPQAVTAKPYVWMHKCDDDCTDAAECDTARWQVDSPDGSGFWGWTAPTRDMVLTYARMMLGRLSGQLQWDVTTDLVRGLGVGFVYKIFWSCWCGAEGEDLYGSQADGLMRHVFAAHSDHPVVRG